MKRRDFIKAVPIAAAEEVITYTFLVWDAKLPPEANDLLLAKYEQATGNAKLTVDFVDDVAAEK